tara:strand:+ start:84 stop:608 length:525 start_codon:yes stop_codon:yes gene_type:complete
MAQNASNTETMTPREQSTEFMNALNSLLELIEELNPNDGQYLQACNDLKTLNDKKVVINQRIIQIVERVRNTRVVAQHTARISRKEHRKQLKRSDTEKLKHGAKRCVRCDRVVFNLNEHGTTYVCHSTGLHKQLAVKVGKHEINRYINLINSINSWAEKTRRYKFGNFTTWRRQ